MDVTLPLVNKPTTAKLPPHSIEAEQSLLGALMIDQRAFEEVADRVRAEDFYRTDHRDIFDAIVTLANRNQPFDVLTIAETLKSFDKLKNIPNGEVYLYELAQNTPSAANAVAYADIVRERSVLRQLVSISAEVSNIVFHPEGKDSKEILDQAERLIFQVSDQQQRGSGPQAISELLVKANTRLDELYHSKGALTGLPTGFLDLDKLTSGLQPGDMVVIAGRPSMGKTSFAMNIAEYAAMKQDKPVLIFSMEMPAESLVLRMISSLGRIDQHKVRTGNLDENDWSRITANVSMLSQRNLYIDDTPALSPMELRTRARRVARKHGGLSLILIDYLQLMSSGISRENRTNEISEISRALKGIAKEFNVPVIALSQLNRSLEQRTDKRPVMSDLRECVVGSTLVCLSNGKRVPIEQLVGEQPEVFSMNDENKLIVAKSDKVWAVGKRQVYQLHLASGRSIKATKDHRLLCESGWQKISDIQVGDRMALSRHLPSPQEHITWSDNKLILLGQMIGDGSYLKGQPMRYTSESIENLEAVKKAVTEEFDCDVKEYAGRNRWRQLLISNNGTRWAPRGVNKWFRELGIFNQRSHEKRIPESVFQLNNNQIGLLLRHLWATDGTIHVRKKEKSRGSHVIHYATNSEGLAFDVAALLMRFHIIARIKKTQKAGYRPGYMVVISGAEYHRLFLKHIGAFGPRVVQANDLAEVLSTITVNSNVDTLPQKIFLYVKQAMKDQHIPHRKMSALRGTSYGGSAHFNFSPSRETLRSYANLLHDNWLLSQCENDIYWDKVTEITPLGEEMVYDLTVPGPANWLADGIVTHNSGAIEQDADVIAFIYRDEVYHEDSPHKGTAEIIIRKHRNGPIGDFRLTFLGQFTRFENYAADRK